MPKLLVHWKLLAGKVRRLFIVALRRDYLQRQMVRRQGQCRQCGNCCTLAVRCPWFSPIRLCRVYTAPYRPRACAVFPIDERDLADVRLASGQPCSYHFPEG